MIYEYALEPEMVASWGSHQNYRYYIREFGLGRCRIISRYPKKWAKMVYDSFGDGNPDDKRRLVELLVRIQETMVKRKDSCWDCTNENWLQNVLVEHSRHPFYAILCRRKSENQQEIIAESDLAATPCIRWDNPHGIVVKRNAAEMAASVQMMLTRCRWVKFIDPHISPGTERYKASLRAFLGLLATTRPVGVPEYVEIHMGQHDATAEFLIKEFAMLIPMGLSASVFQWKEKTGGQQLHNRYILTDIGGVSFSHGLDTGDDGETDDITRLDREMYDLHCSQYDRKSTAFDEAAPMLEISGKLSM